MNYLTVTALTKYIKAKLEGDKHLISLYIKGEISNFKRHSRGHLYFTLKDQQTQISAIMFSNLASKLLFEPKEGDQVLIQAKMSVYEAGGTYSLQVFEMKPDGIGELYLKYEALKKDLESKGYFDVKHKKTIPKFPKKIGVITSPTGAVIEDIKHTVTRRYPLVEIHLYPALVQGTGSKESICEQIKSAQQNNEVDVLIIGRGGGSIEDLWSFNELEVVMAIFNCQIPTITAIGHETDYTISDFVSDLRAPTPTAAAELATPNQMDLIQFIHDLEEQATYRITQYLSNKQTELMYLDQRLEHMSPSHQLKMHQKTFEDFKTLLHRNFNVYLDHKTSEVKFITQQIKTPSDLIDKLEERYLRLQKDLSMQIKYVIEQKAYAFELLKSKMIHSNPLTVMDKGFALVKKDNDVITSIQQMAIDDTVDLYLKDGQIKAIIKEKKGYTHGKEII